MSNRPKHEKDRRKSLMKKIQAELNVKKAIVETYNGIAVPVIKTPIALMYFNPMLPFIIEGYLEENLNRIKGR